MIYRLTKRAKTDLERIYHYYLTVSDDGGCDYEHAEWDDESSCFCQGCDHHAQVKDFTGEGA